MEESLSLLRIDNLLLEQLSSLLMDWCLRMLGMLDECYNLSDSNSKTWDL